MIKYSTIIHLRFPFSVFLLPIYLFALSQSPNVAIESAVLVFIVLHLLVYPASNGYNSYFDKDEGSIGGIKTPPKVSLELYYVSLILDGIALIISFVMSWQFGAGILIYGLASKAYSHPGIRLKKYPVIGLLTIGFFQGFATYIISFMQINSFSFPEAVAKGWHPAALATILLLGSYPMTQIYQHDEDTRRGDITLSSILGVRGTFHFTAIFFGIATLGFIGYFLNNESRATALLFLIFLAPTITFFFAWYLKVRKDDVNANYQNTMRLNLISAAGLSIFFLIITLFKM